MAEVVRYHDHERPDAGQASRVVPRSTPSSLSDGGVFDFIDLQLRIPDHFRIQN